jgi:hypothetical protein
MSQLSPRRLAIALCALVLALWTLPAQADSTAFGPEAVARRVAGRHARSHRSSRPVTIAVRLSPTAAPVRLRLRERPIKIVTTDLNHDGRLYIAALLPTRGVVLFSRTTRGFHRIHRARGTLPQTTFTSIPVSLQQSPSNSGRSLDESRRDDDDGEAISVERTVGPPRQAAVALAASPSTPFSLLVSRTHAARAPPA